MTIAIIEDDANLRHLLNIVYSDLKLAIEKYDNGWEGLDDVTQKIIVPCA